MRMRSGGSGAYQLAAAVTRESDFLHPAVKTVKREGQGLSQISFRTLPVFKGTELS